MICGIALSRTSVAVFHDVRIKTGLIEPDFGQFILAACFITDFGMVAALEIQVANYDWTLVVFDPSALLALWVAPYFVRWFITRLSAQVSTMEVTGVFFALFAWVPRPRPPRANQSCPPSWSALRWLM